MGFVDYQTSLTQTTHSVSETARFGHSTDRIIVGLAAAGALPHGELTQAVQSALEESRATIVVLRYPSELVSLARDVRVEGRVGYSGGSIAYWEVIPRHAELASKSATEVTQEDRARFHPNILKVLEDSFEGYVNHYSANPLLPPGVVVNGYSDWAEASMANPANRLFVVWAGEVIVGAAVVAVSSDLWEIELASISPSAQRRGHYTELISKLLSSAHHDGVARVVISTQSHNVGVQRAWVKLGFLPVASIETVHLIDEITLEQFYA